jgi:UrcA family protein
VQPPPPVAQAPGVLVGGRRQGQDVPFRRVPLADLNLATDVGACKALSRIRRAAEEVCPYEGERGLSFLRVRWMCMQESVNRAVQDMHVRKVEDLLDKGHSGC